MQCGEGDSRLFCDAQIFIEFASAQGEQGHHFS